MLKISINVEKEAAEARLAAITSGLADRAGLHASMATAVESTVKDHLTARYVPKNKHGNFWERVRDSIEVRSDENEASVSLVEIGIGLRYRGGEVRPGRNPAASGPNKGGLTKALAIPSSSVPVSAGRQLPPARMGLLAFLRKATGGETVGFLVEGEEKKNSKGKTYIARKPGGSLLYTLRTVTRHVGDKGILPAESELTAAAGRAARDWIGSFEE